MTPGIMGVSSHNPISALEMVSWLFWGLFGEMVLDLLHAVIILPPSPLPAY